MNEFLLWLKRWTIVPSHLSNKINPNNAFQTDKILQGYYCAFTHFFNALPLYIIFTQWFFDKKRSISPKGINSIFVSKFEDQIIILLICLKDQSLSTYSSSSSSSSYYLYGLFGGGGMDRLSTPVLPKCCSRRDKSKYFLTIWSALSKSH